MGRDHRLVVIDVPFGESADAFSGVARAGFVVVKISPRDASLDLVMAENPDLVIVDVDSDPVRARRLLDEEFESRIDALETRRTAWVTVGSMATRSARAEIADFMALGAIQHIDKPLTKAVVASVLALAVGADVGQKKGATESAAGSLVGTNIVGNSPAIRDVLHRVERAAPSDLTVLITGESGTGKELIARAIHETSRRRQRPFVAINCAAIAEGLLESELFGHERGAFTGAASRRVGRFEQANGGTLFLDEIGDMSPSMQARVLRVLQEGVLERVGGNELVRVEVRTIAATHRDLAAMMRAGSFREDLFYRLNVVSIKLPPLRERREDIALLVDHFLACHASRLGRPGIRVSDAVRAALSRLDWPGNARQLSHCIEQAILLSDGAEIALRDVEISDQADRAPSSEQADTVLTALALDALKRSPGRALSTLVRRVEESLVAESLRLCGNNLSRAAWLLGVSRPTLRERIRRMDFEDASGSPPLHDTHP